ncbi:MAG TPA: beta-galactosidase, partial [Armatimonadota bacterium]
MAAFSAVTPILTTPLSQWRIEANPDDAVTLAAQDECLVVNYRLHVNTVQVAGNQTFQQGAFRLLLAKPLPLSADQTRILFAAKGIESAPNNGAVPRADLCPIVSDANGEQFIYRPIPVPHLNAGTKKWSTWMSNYFYAGEAGGATYAISDAAGGDGNCQPDGALTFLGFQGQIRREKAETCSGQFALGAIQIGGMKVAYEEPYAYADSLLTQQGAYQIAYRVADAFQGRPLHESTMTLTYNPESLASQKQRIAFPLGADGNYWITYQITDETGRVVDGDTMRYQVEGKTQAASALPPVNLQAVPAFGYLRINPERHSNGVYGNHEPLTVVVRVYPKSPQPLTVSWQLLPYFGETALESGTTTVDTKRTSRDLQLKLHGEAGRDAYRLHLTVQRAGVTVDTQDYTLGRQTDFRHPYGTRTGKILDRDYVKQSPYNRLTFCATSNGADRLLSEDATVQQFCAFLDHSAQVTRYVTYELEPAAFEVLPGVFDFCLLDRLMDAAADRGAAITVCFKHADQHKKYAWLKYSRQYSYDGTPIAGHQFYGGYAQTDSDFLAGWFRAFKAIHDRYATHPGFQGYYIMQPGGEWTVLDRPWEGVIAGYEQSTRPVFRAYLQQTLQLSLSDLNARWHTAYRAWDDVYPPMPDFTTGKTPDTRMSWVDFCRFKADLEKRWFH